MVRERVGRRAVGAVAIFLTAIALQRACTLPWGRGTSLARVPYEVSAVGLSRLPVGDNRSRVDCRWWPRYGDATLCAPAVGAPASHAALRRTYPLLQVGLWLSVASLLLQALRVPRSRMVQGAVPAAVAACSATAVVSLLQGAQRGLAALDGVSMSFTGSGALSAYVAVAASTLSAAMVLTSFAAPAPGDPAVDGTARHPGDGTVRGRA